MSSETRKYELKARAESQRETRDRIARAAAELHVELGPARTTVAEIARRSGVTRLTVYNHFADLAALLPACSAHYATLHPAPDFASALAVEDDQDRICAALTLWYGWYRETADMWTKVLSDRVALPELDEFLSNGIDQLQRDLAEALATPGGDPEERVLLLLAVDFWTWWRLSNEGLDDDSAARLMAATVVREGARA
ncbi:MAG: TetR/AcrR family transcriptional regulator [Marmoricola sp.]